MRYVNQGGVTMAQQDANGQSVGSQRAPMSARERAAMQRRISQQVLAQLSRDDPGAANQIIFGNAEDYRNGHSDVPWRDRQDHG